MSAAHIHRLHRAGVFIRAGQRYARRCERALRDRRQRAPGSAWQGFELLLAIENLRNLQDCVARAARILTEEAAK